MAGNGHRYIVSSYFCYFSLLVDRYLFYCWLLIYSYLFIASH